MPLPRGLFQWISQTCPHSRGRVPLPSIHLPQVTWLVRTNGEDFPLPSHDTHPTQTQRKEGFDHLFQDYFNWNMPLRKNTLQMVQLGCRLFWDFLNITLAPIQINLFITLRVGDTDIQDSFPALRNNKQFSKNRQRHLNR